MAYDDAEIPARDATPEVDDATRAARWPLVLAHRAVLLRIARRRGLSADDADDVVQDALLRCVEFPALDEDKVLPFLVSLTKRLCVDRQRLLARDQRIGVKLTAWYVDESSPEDAVCDRAEAIWLADEVLALPERQRAVLADRADGLTCAEVAARHRMSYKAVESLLSRARSQARAVLATSFAATIAALRRLRQPAPAAASLTLAALTTLSLALVLPRQPGETRPPVYVTPRAGATVAGVRAVASPEPVARRVPAAPRGVAATTRPPVRGEEPDIYDLGYIEESLGPMTVIIDVFPSDNDPYSLDERLRHCVDHGLNPNRPGTCNYPPEYSRSPQP